MRIQVIGGVGSGPTELAAFDAALIAAGVANFNLLTMSSVIPPQADVLVEDSPVAVEGAWGDRLYVVLAQQQVTIRNAEAWAGLGWVQDASGRGLFVEHHGGSRDEVEGDISDSLSRLVQNRGHTFGHHHVKVVGITCRDNAVCALVVAVYQSTGWESVDAV